MSSAQGITISLFLADGSPSGLIVAELKTRWTGKVFNFSQSSLKDVLGNRPELDTAGVYLLQSPEGTLYIGEAESIKSRLLKHYQDNKIDFDRATVIISKDDNFPKAHARYLEARLLDIVREKIGDRLENKTKGTPVSLPESERTDMEYYLQQIRLMLPILGMDFLQEIAKPTKMGNSGQLGEISPEFELTFDKGRIQAEAFTADGQFVVRAGAICRHPENATASLSRKTLEDLQLSWLAGILVEDQTLSNGLLRLMSDKSFKSPSAAGSFVCGTAVSGPWYWRLKSTGQTYGEWQTAQLMSIQNEE